MKEVYASLSRPKYFFLGNRAVLSEALRAARNDPRVPSADTA